MTKDWPTEVVFRSAHNHSLSSAAVLQYRNMSDDVRRRLCKLFRQGHSPSSALHCIKTDLLIEHGDDYYLFAADGFYAPSLSVVSKLFSKEFVSEYGSNKGFDMLASLEAQVKQYNDQGVCKAQFGRVGDNYFVSLCTSLMARAHKFIPQTSELVMVDAAGGLDKQRHRLYLFICPTAAGGVPLGAIIADSEREEVFSAALQSLQQCFPCEAFFGTGTPQVVLTDNDLKERQPLQKQFPSARLLLCVFHVLKAVWSWLCDSHHGISRGDRQEIYMAFKRVLYATDELEVSAKFDALMKLTAVEDSAQCTAYLENMWACRTDWALAFRTGLPLRGSNTTNYIEVAFRVIKDCILDRVMAFSLPQLLDFLVTRYEAYMEKRLIDFSNGRYCKSMLRNMSLVESDIPDDSISSAVDESAGLYSVRSSSSGNVYDVDLAKGFCTCYVGACGKICKHASAVLLQTDAEMHTRYNVVSQEVKMVLFRVATNQCPPSEWFLPLTNCPAAQKDNNVPMSQSHNEPDVSQQWESSQNESAEVAQNISLSVEDFARLSTLFSRIKQGLTDSPEIFVPACQRMLNNAEKFASTETGLVSAMYTFAKYSGMPAIRGIRKYTSINAWRRRGVQIGVQPTAVGRRKLLLSGKRRLSAGRPSGLVSARNAKQLAEHDYTVFGSLPSRKRRAPHSLQQCVYSNVGLGGKKQAKM